MYQANYTDFISSFVNSSKFVKTAISDLLDVQQLSSHSLNRGQLYKHKNIKVSLIFLYKLSFQCLKNENKFI